MLDYFCGNEEIKLLVVSEQGFIEILLDPLNRPKIFIRRKNICTSYGLERVHGEEASSEIVPTCTVVEHATAQISADDHAFDRSTDWLRAGPSTQLRYSFSRLKC